MYSRGNIDTMETHVYVLDACGDVIRTYEYNEAMYMAGTAPNINEPSVSICDCVESPVTEWYDRGENPLREMYPYTSIAELNFGDRIAVYPNPASDQITFAGDFLTKRGKTLEVYSIDGKLIRKQVLSDEESNFTLKTSAFDPGIYFYSIKAEGSSHVDGKFIINK